MASIFDFDSNLVPSWVPTWPMLAPKSHNNRPKRLPRRAWEPESAQTPPRLRCWSIFGRYLIDIWPMLVNDYAMFHRFVIGFWSIFAHCFFDLIYCSLFFFFTCYLRFRRGGSFTVLLRFHSFTVYIEYKAYKKPCRDRSLRKSWSPGDGTSQDLFFRARVNRVCLVSFIVIRGWFY